MDALTSQLFLLAEQAKTYSKLNGIDARIWGSKSSVRNMHVANFSTDVVFAAREVQADGAAGSKIDPGRCFGDFGIGKESAAADFEIGNDAGVGVQRPLESERIYANAVSGVRFLSNEEDRDGVDRIFQAAAKKTWPMRFAEDQAVTKTHVPDAVAGLAASDPVAASGPNLQFVAALDRAGLRAN